MFSVFVLGFASQASADTLTDANGEPVETGSEITLTSTNLTSTFTGGFSTGCLNLIVPAEVAENGPEQIAVVPLNLFASGCLLEPGNFAMFINSPVFGTITLSEGVGSAVFGSTENVPAAGLSCTYGGTFNFSYEVETNVLAVPGSTFTGGGSGGCPESKEMHGEFTLKNGLGPVTIN